MVAYSKCREIMYSGKFNLGAAQKISFFYEDCNLLQIYNIVNRIEEREILMMIVAV